jgi:hypothetical protein
LSVRGGCRTAAIVTIPRAGHTVQGDNPKDLVTELRRFLAPEN